MISNRRRRQTALLIKKRIQQSKTQYGVPALLYAQPHRLAKRVLSPCRSSKCFICHPSKHGKRYKRSETNDTR